MGKARSYPRSFLEPIKPAGMTSPVRYEYFRPTASLQKGPAHTLTTLQAVQTVWARGGSVLRQRFIHPLISSWADTRLSSELVDHMTRRPVAERWCPPRSSSCRHDPETQFLISLEERRLADPSKKARQGQGLHHTSPAFSRCSGRVAARAFL